MNAQLTPSNKYLVACLTMKEANGQDLAVDLFIPMMNLKEDDSFCAINRFELLKKLTEANETSS